MPKTNSYRDKSARKYAAILNIRVDSTELVEVLKFVTEKLAKKEKFYIVTPNPEIILEATRDSELARILNKADLSIPDGVGLLFAANFLGQSKLSLLPGRKVMLEFLKLANKKRLKVFFLGSTEAVIKKSLEKVDCEFPSLLAEGFSGPVLDKNGIPVSKVELKKEKMTIDKINKFAPDFLFVAFGAPKQEKWLYKWLPQLHIGGAMVVGGALDYYAGIRQLPPAWMVKIGAEWLWRLVNEPRRAGRIFRATVIFPLKVLTYRLI